MDEEFVNGNGATMFFSKTRLVKLIAMLKGRVGVEQRWPVVTRCAVAVSPQSEAGWRYITALASCGIFFVRKELYLRLVYIKGMKKNEEIIIYNMASYNLNLNCARLSYEALPFVLTCFTNWDKEWDGWMSAEHESPVKVKAKHPDWPPWWLAAVWVSNSAPSI